MVLERGLSGIRVADVAKATNVSGGLIHYHFATKDELVTAMLRAEIRAEMAWLEEIAADTSPAVVRLDRMLRYNIPESRADTGWMLWLDAWAAALREETVRSIVFELEQAWIRALAQIIRDGVAAGDFVCPDPEGAAERIDAMLDGLIIRYTLHPEVLSQERLVEHARIAAAREVGVDASAFTG